MGRVYIKLECGCYVSCDGGGGLIPCDFNSDNPGCEFFEWHAKHPSCPWCGECLICHPDVHDKCPTREAARKKWKLNMEQDNIQMESNHDSFKENPPIYI